jgi:hypothetical protein
MERVGGAVSFQGPLFFPPNTFRQFLTRSLPPQVLKASRADIAFQAVISHDRCRHFVEAHLDSQLEGNLGTALAYIARSPRISKLVLHQDAVSLIDSGSTSVSVRRLGTDAWRRLAKQVPELHLHGFDGWEGSTMLKRWSSVLRELHLVCTASDGPRLFTAPFMRSLASTSNLQALHISAPEIDPPGPPTLDFAHLATFLLTSDQLPPLRHLSLSIPFFNASTLAFLRLFSVSLLSLSLTSSTYDGEAVDEPAFTDESFPQLRTLRILGHYNSHLINSVRRQAVPNLQHLEVAQLDRSYSVDEWVGPILGELKQLVTLRVHEGTPLEPEETVLLATLCSSANPSLEVFDTPALPVKPSPGLFIPESLSPFLNSFDRAAYWSFVKSLLPFLADEVARAERTQDDASIAGLATAMKALELERLVRIG